MVADRRAGSAGGLGLGLSGGELMALALGAGYFNQLHFSAEALGIEISDAEVDVRVDFDGDPLRVAGATVDVRLAVEGSEADKARLLEHAERESTISGSVVNGFPVSISQG
ncbi:OsmC family protein [Tropicimonas aquimaris]|uniref:OsmC family protein n=1 Tax=Tropicimonas aquimaris TaxID=914152 RepID=A0ABW3IKY4_9RHOB